MRRSIGFALAGALAAGLTVPSSAVALPSWPSTAYCDQDHSCLQEESEAERDLRQQWDDVPEDVANFCERESSVSGDIGEPDTGSYVDLERCIRRELRN